MAHTTPKQHSKTHNVLGEILDVLQSQLLADDLQITDGIHLSLNMSDIIVIKCSYIKYMHQ
jgi:hypothetical protein